MPDDHPDDLRAKVFRDRVDLANWRAEMLDETGAATAITPGTKGL
jgi:hypothetical protein